MWGFADGSFFAVGEAGTVLHYDGMSWTPHDTPAREDLHGVWASGPNDVYAAGFDGTLIHFDGAKWSLIPCPTQTDFYAVWASSVNDVFLAGAGGSVWNLRNDQWTEASLAPGKRFRALWGYAHNDVYVAGSNGSLFHFDGISWNPVTIVPNPQTTIEFRDLWGPSSGSLSLVGGSSIAWFEGSTWSASGVADENVYGLWGLSIADQVAVSAGSSSHWVGGVFAWFPTPTEEPLFDVWGRATNDYYAVGRYGNVARFDGTGWRALNDGLLSDIRDVHVRDEGALAVGAHGALLRQNGSNWIEENAPPGYELAGVWDSGSAYAIAVGRYSADGFHWRQATLVNTNGIWNDAGAIGDAYRYFDVWGSSPTNVYVVGWGGEIVRYDGSGWSEVFPDSGNVAMLRCITGLDASTIVSVGRTNNLRGLIAQYDGTMWHVSEYASAEELFGAWIDNSASAFAVGARGAIMRFDGATWTSMASPTSEALLSVWGNSSSDVYAVGWGGTIVHYDGSTWRRLLPQTHRTLTSISGDSSGDLIITGDKGTILLYRSTVLP